MRATASGVLMRVFINNRLGTENEVPCSPSDTIGAFKKVAAEHLGTRPEAMILKRQGERPLKDFLTLEDYEIRNGSSLDLEIDTGDWQASLSHCQFLDTRSIHRLSRNVRSLGRHITVDAGRRTCYFRTSKKTPDFVSALDHTTSIEIKLKISPTVVNGHLHSLNVFRVSNLPSLRMTSLYNLITLFVRMMVRNV